jgi:hypothetical protein
MVYTSGTWDVAVSSTMSGRRHIDEVKYDEVKYDEVVFGLPSWQLKSSTSMLAWRMDEGWKSTWS